MRLILDTGVLGHVVHPRKHPEAKRWLAAIVRVHEVLVSEVRDYELRRELIRIGALRSLDRLDELERELQYVPVTTSVWRSVEAELAARQRRRRTTSKDDYLARGVLFVPEEDLARDLLNKLKASKFTLDWRKKARRRAAVRTTIQDVLDALPDAYSDDLFEEKCEQVYEHVYESSTVTERANTGARRVMGQNKRQQRLLPLRGRATLRDPPDRWQARRRRRRPVTL
jgi:predicted nucleic acid-binding protein